MENQISSIHINSNTFKKKTKTAGEIINWLREKFEKHSVFSDKWYDEEIILGLELNVIDQKIVVKFSTIYGKDGNQNTNQPKSNKGDIASKVILTFPIKGFKIERALTFEHQGFNSKTPGSIIFSSELIEIQTKTRDAKDYYTVRKKASEYVYMVDAKASYSRGFYIKNKEKDLYDKIEEAVNQLEVLCTEKKDSYNFNT